RADHAGLPVDGLAASQLRVDRAPHREARRRQGDPRMNHAQLLEMIRTPPSPGVPEILSAAPTRPCTLKTGCPSNTTTSVSLPTVPWRVSVVFSHVESNVPVLVRPFVRTWPVA